MKIEYLNKVTGEKLAIIFRRMWSYSFYPCGCHSFEKKGCMWTVTSKYLTTAEWQIKDT